MPRASTAGQASAACPMTSEAAAVLLIMVGYQSIRRDEVPPGTARPPNVSFERLTDSPALENDPSLAPDGAQGYHRITIDV